MMNNLRSKDTGKGLGKIELLNKIKPELKRPIQVTMIKIYTINELDFLEALNESLYVKILLQAAHLFIF